jgi:hypothetical protein
MKAFALALLVIQILTPVFAVELLLSGRLAQSQEESLPPFEGIGGSICEIPGTRHSLFACSGTLWKIRADTPPEKIGWAAVGGRMIHDGKNVFLVRNHNEIFRVNPDNDTWIVEKKFLHLQATGHAFAVAHVGTTAEFGGKGKFFLLNKKSNEVAAFDQSGKALGTVLHLPDLPRKSTSYHPFWNIIFVPRSGHLIAVSYYPDRSAYLFRADGEQITTNGWPIRRNIWAGSHGYANSMVWGLGDGALMFPENATDKNTMIKIGGASDRGINGIAPDGEGGYWLSSGVGLKHFVRGNFKEAARRLGGAGKVKTLAINRGMVVVSLGNLLYALYLDDDADSPFLSHSAEEWRTGYGWSGSGQKIVQHGTGFALWDSTNSCFWQFEPSKTGQERWQKGAEAMPEVTAVCEANGVIVTAERGNFKTLSGVLALAAPTPGLIVAASKNTVTAFDNEMPVWSRELPNVCSLAAAAGFVAVSTGEELLLLDAVRGDIAARTPSKVTEIAAEGRWLLGFDPYAFALLRYRIK